MPSPRLRLKVDPIYGRTRLAAPPPAPSLPDRKQGGYGSSPTAVTSDAVFTFGSRLVVDRLTPQRRAALMGRVKGRDTGPELRVRRALHAAGFRFRLHRRDLPGRPDVVLPAFDVAVFVHGCFWHRHDCPKGNLLPKTNEAFWEKKLNRNAARDTAVRQALEEAGWTVAIVWECGLDASLTTLLEELRRRRDQHSGPGGVRTRAARVRKTSTALPGKCR